MAYRTWGRVLLVALGVGLLAGAGQLGFAYGLGVVRFARDFEQLSGQWAAHLAWVAWFAMLAAVAGGLAGRWLARRYDLPAESVGARVAVSVAGGIGALAVAPLAMLPARVATIGSGNAVTIAGLSAALGALVGVFGAAAVLSLRVAGLNLGAVTAVVWLIALLSVAPSLGPGDPLPEVRLGVLDATWLGDGLAQRLAVIVMPAIALATGAGIGALARRRGLPLIPVAVSGVVGPLLLALAYLIAGPGDGGDRYQAAPYWGALIAVGAGGLGSVLAAVARQPRSGDRDAVGPAPRHGDHTAEVFPGHAGGGAATTPTSGDATPTESFTTGFTSAGDDEPASGERAGRDRWGDDGPTGSLARPDHDSPVSGTDLFGNSGGALGGGPADHDAPSGAGSGPFGSADPLSGSPGAAAGSGSGSWRARDLGDADRMMPRATDASPFSSPTPVAPPRQPEIVSPPPVPEPTPVRPLHRQPAAGPGDWRTDKTSAFNAASVPVVPAGPTPGSLERADGEFPQRPTSIRPAPATPGRVPRQAGSGDGGLRPIDLPGSAESSAGAGLSWSERPGATVRRDISTPNSWSRDGSEPHSVARGGSAPNSGSRGGSEPNSGGRDGLAPNSAGRDGEMSDWRLAPPAWTPPPPITPGEPAPGAADEVTPVGVAEAAPAKERKRRGLFRRKEKPPATASESASAPESASGSAPDAADGGWVDVPTSPQADAPAAPAASGRHGQDNAGQSWGSWADRAGAQPADAAGPAQSATVPDQPSSGRRSSRAERRRRGADLADAGVGSWDIDNPAPPAAGPTKAADTIGADTKAGDTKAAGTKRAGTKAARSKAAAKKAAGTEANGAMANGTTADGTRADSTTAVATGAADTKAGDTKAGDTWAGDTKVGGAGDRGTKAGDTKAEQPDDTESRSAPSRGLFRRKGNSADPTETRLDPAGGDKPEPRRRGKSEKPIGQRDEEYVDWVTALGTPEPVNERHRDDTPRRSLRSTTAQKDN